jgi:outer membrane receptor protein involved in Fe transport
VALDLTPSYHVWYLQCRKRVTTAGAYVVSLYGQVDNLFDQRDVFLVDVNGGPIPGEFQFWLPPRTFQVGVTIDMDWTH